MNKQQKEVIQAQLNNEKACLESIKEAYEGALADVNDKIANLLGRNDSDLQNVIYQVQYQNTIKAQIEPILAQLQANSFETMSDYLNKCYEEGFLGTMYNLQSQGIPLIFPIDQAQVVDAITKETKLSTNLYSRLGKDVNKLKKDISAEISRGISQNMTYNSIASNISLYAGISRNNAVRIAKTEGHRISSKASMDACVEAKENGADVVKQWDATLDSKTRDSHRQCDGEVVEIDEEFSNGLMYPSDPMGDAEETINCRCVLLERARWAVENDSFTKFEGFSGKMMEFDSAQDYAEFKERYWSDANIKEMQFVKDMQEKYDTKEFGSLLMSMSDQEYEKYSELHENNPFFKEVSQGGTKDEEIKTENPDVEVSDILSIAESNDIIYEYPTKEQYSGLVKASSKNTSKEDKEQIAKHTKADGSQGGYVATGNYSTINSNMRSDGFTLKKLDEDDQKTIEALRRAISENQLDNDYIMTRYVNADYITSVFGIKGKEYARGEEEKLTNFFTRLANPYIRNQEIPRITKELQSMVGREITEKAFISTSAFPDKNIMKDKAVMFNIKAKKGTNCYVAKNRKESECIFGDGSKLTIADVSWNEISRQWIIDAIIN